LCTNSSPSCSISDILERYSDILISCHKLYKLDVAFTKFSACSTNTSIIALSLERIQDSQPLVILPTPINTDIHIEIYQYR
jgi:hypothetical protein